ncbi:hypothetical protein [Segatella copri]|uniref:hypothetical protein n=1 Tax=Segatella copri TaxID=165179 RepID=UPI00222EBA99|nr:hypothetical protein [Segatella copri]MCW4101527.1 hypothetical protein [Segatella copri]
MKELSVKGAQGYEHVSTKVSSYVTECKGSAVLAQSLEVLNSYRKKLLSECTDSEVVSAKKELEKARAKYNKLATNYVLSDESYCNLQTECVRSAVSEFSRKHKLPNFFAWFDNNNKDVQTTIIDSLQRLGSKLCSLHQAFSSGAKVAKRKSESITDLQKQIAELQAKLLEAQK